MSTPEVEELLDTLECVIAQACQVTENEETFLDSMALSAYAEGMRLLAKHDRLVIDNAYGRRVIGHWPPATEKENVG